MAWEGLGWMVATSIMLGSLKEFDVFFMNQFSQKPLSIPLGSFRIFYKFREIFADQGAPPVSTTPVLNLPLVPMVSLIQSGKFATVVSDTGGSP
jgi:hypothetical protein